MKRRTIGRIRKIEEDVSAARKIHVDNFKQFMRAVATLALRHATAVAAIVLSGQPRVDEPLNRAWARALQQYGIDINSGQEAAAQRLYPIIVGGEKESERFSEIFRTAPVWLLQFTGMVIDSRFLPLQLPDLSPATRWGSAGYEEARRWPLIPSGMMAAGDPIPDSDERRLWLLLFCMITEGGTFADYGDSLFQVDEEIRSPGAEVHPLDDICLALDLDRKPESEWSRYEKRRMRKLSEWISSFQR
jgi:hypothetical protein